MSTQMSPVPEGSPEAIRREMKRRFDAVNAAAEDRHQLRRDLGDIAEAKAYNRPRKYSSYSDVDRDDSDGMGENDSLGG
jgi:hypothetical protein